MADLTITRERTALFQIAVTQLVNGTATPVDLTGKTLYFVAKESLTGPEVIAKSSPGSGITISSPASAGLAVLQINPADTASILDIPSSYLTYDMKLEDGPNEYQVASGQVRVYGNVGP